ncbi:transporter substrate-binding domain-containing protein [Amycolatopsis nigrescens]|uniref:transporter substrate-binding domain-containing protein n=1 Tax=Amycolatopsis nigrescens TaxID=381445 RepID=UPI0012F95CED|nr:transporter substrate-binding domain-containing protein [Amycolatopsis nigrescens]
MSADDPVEDVSRQRKPARKFPWTWTRFTALIAVVVLAIAVIFISLWWQQKPSVDDLMEQAHLKGKSELVIGVMDDVPGAAVRDPTDRYVGFEIEIGYLVAADLGFRPHETRFLTVENEDRNRMQARDGDRHTIVDLVIAVYSITEERERDDRVSFSASYLDTEQSVLTLREHPPVQDLTELRDKPVCTLNTSTSKNPLQEARAEVINKSKISDCLPGLHSGEYEAVSTDAAILAGFVAKEPDRLRLHDIGLSAVESYGINTGGNEPLLQLVNHSLYGSRNDPEDKRWEDAYDKHLRPLEAAGLPQPVAIDRQPDVDEVEVRQWPWERLPGMILMLAAMDGRCRVRRRVVSNGP